MKVSHFYASPEPKEFEREQVNLLDLVTSYFTKEMVLWIIARHASGHPPYYLYVPSPSLYDAHQWRIPTTLLVIEPIPEKPNDISPIAVAKFVTGTETVLIYARRCVSCESLVTYDSP